MEIPAMCVIYENHKALEVQTHPALKHDMTSYTPDPDIVWINKLAL